MFRCSDSKFFRNFGVGIADAWTGKGDTKDHWRDSHYKIEGPAVAQMQAAFGDNWIKTRSKVLFGSAYFPELTQPGRSRAQVFESSPSEGSESVRLIFVPTRPGVEHWR